MTGPEHYRTAERLIAALRDVPLGSEKESALLAEAQVHATLALAAAVAGLDAHEGPGGGSATGRTLTDVSAWEKAFGGGE